MLVVCLLALLRLGGLDDQVANWFYDVAARHFPLRHAWFTETVMHDVARFMMQLIGAALLLTAASFFFNGLAAWFRPLLFVSLSMMLSVVLFNLGKHFSATDCPWDLVRYGGTRPYTHLFAAKPAVVPAGHCFPGGHSSAGFAFFAPYFAARRVGWAYYRWLLLPPMVLGLAFAVTQWSRGAHFPSHDLVTAYVCWMVPLLVLRAFFSSQQVCHAR